MPRPKGSTNAPTAELMRVRFGKTEAITRERTKRPVPDFVMAALRGSWTEYQADPNGNNAYGADVKDEAQANALVTEFRRAANEIGCGVALKVTTKDDGTAHVSFQAKPRKQRKPKDQAEG